MVTKGGYKLIDFGGVDISTSKTISGIYNKIADTEKRIVGCNITLGTTKFKELTLDVKLNGTSYELSNSILKITITNANAVVGEENTNVEEILEYSADNKGQLGKKYKITSKSQLALVDGDETINVFVNGIDNIALTGLDDTAIVMVKINNGRVWYTALNSTLQIDEISVSDISEIELYFTCVGNDDNPHNYYIGVGNIEGEK